MNQASEQLRNEELNKQSAQRIQEFLISKPPRIMTALQHFRFEKQAEKMAKKKIDPSLVSKLKSIGAQWQELTPQKKQYYNEFYKKRKEDLDAIKSDFRILIGQNNIVNPYLCYYRQRYPILAEAYPQKDGKFLTKIIAGNWNKLSALSKIQFQKQAQQINAKAKIGSQNKKQLIKYYELKVKSYKQQIQKQKQRILEKYSFKKRQKNEKNITETVFERVEHFQKGDQPKQKKKQFKNEDKRLKSQKVWQFKIDHTIQLGRSLSKIQNKQIKLRKNEIKPYNPTQPARKELQSAKHRKQVKSEQKSNDSDNEKEKEEDNGQTRGKRRSKRDRKQSIIYQRQGLNKNVEKGKTENKSSRQK